MTTTITPDKRLRTVKQAAKEIGASEGFLWQLLREGTLTLYKVHRATYISMAEFESITIQIRKPKRGENGNGKE